MEITIKPAAATAVRTKTPAITEEQSLILSISQVRAALDDANDRFNLESDMEMIDCHIYEISALEQRLNCLLHRAKSKGMQVRAVPAQVYDRIYEG